MRRKEWERGGGVNNGLDSGNSGSLQSSSGGDEEYDSRAAGSRVGGGIFSLVPPYFDPLANYLQLHQSPTASILDSNTVWPRITSVRADQISSGRDAAGMVRSSATVEMDEAGIPVIPPLPTQNQESCRNPRKRSRSSRRAPTTVLTTDTTNFMAMVQEFTGIPAAPFDGVPSFSRARLDLFGPSRSATCFSPSPPAAAYLRRSIAQKIHLPPLPFLASAVGIASSSTNSVITSSMAADAPVSNLAMNNYQTSQNHLQTPLLGNILQTNPKFPFSDRPLKLFTLGVGHGHNFMPSDQISHHSISEKDKEGGDQGLKLMRSPLNDGYNFPGGTETIKLNANFLDGGREKQPENNPNAAGEGLVESWICSSD